MSDPFERVLLAMVEGEKQVYRVGGGLIRITYWGLYHGDDPDPIWKVEYGDDNTDLPIPVSGLGGHRRVR